MLEELLRRKPIVPWSSDAKIPWNDPVFGARMLREHLSQQHDRASRRFETIDSHVLWIHQTFCGAKPGSSILDLGCGPGFYTSRLAELGHDCVGVDFSSASIAYARAESDRKGLRCVYRLQDLREAEFMPDFDVVLFASGELNTFPPSEGQAIVDNARRALRPGGWLIIEVHSERFVQDLGAAGCSWYTARESVFSDEPHLCLKESVWHPAQSVATERYFVASVKGGDIVTYVSTTQAYTDEQYVRLLQQARFDGVKRYASLTGRLVESDDGLFVLAARSGAVSSRGHR